MGITRPRPIRVRSLALRQKVARPLVLLAIAAAAAGCGASSHTSTVTVTTVVAEVPVETLGQYTPQYPPGFPKEVPVSQTPERMSDYLRTGGATTAVAVAPGVWVYKAPGTTVDEDAAAGSLIGWCASVNKFEAYNPDRPTGNTCW